MLKNNNNKADEKTAMDSFLQGLDGVTASAARILAKSINAGRTKKSITPQELNKMINKIEAVAPGFRSLITIDLPKDEAPKTLTKAKKETKPEKGKFDYREDEVKENLKASKKIAKEAMKSLKHFKKPKYNVNNVFQISKPFESLAEILEHDKVLTIVINDIMSCDDFKIMNLNKLYQI